MCPNCTTMRYLLLSSLLALGLTASSQVPDYVPSDGLVAWYGFANSGLEGTGNAPAMLLVGNATFTTDRSGIENNALDPNGGSANTDGPFFDYGWGDAFSLSMWFTRPLNTGGNARLISTECPEGNFRIANDAAGQGIIAQMGSYMYLNALSDAWHQLVYTYDGDATKRVYLDGALYAEEVETDFEPQNFCNPLALGRKASSSGSDLWPGDIDDLGIWDRCLGEEEILGLYLSEVLVYGCTNEEACNYNPEANVDDGSCLDCALFEERCGLGTMWDESVQLCVVANPSDTNFDGCVSMTDLLDLLTVFGTCNEVPWSCGDPLEYQGYDYETVQIGEQCWFAENLRNEFYLNGDAVAANLNESDWSEATHGALSIYFDWPGNLVELGYLYNWYAVSDSRSLCPNGWHVPTDGEWMILEIGLGMSEDDAIDTGGRGTDQGDQMKSEFGWWYNGDENLDSNGSNSSGFTGLQGGQKFREGWYQNHGEQGHWWSSSPDTSNSCCGPRSWSRSLSATSGLVGRSAGPTQSGRSVRCLKDSE